MQALHDLKTTGHASTMKMYHSAIRRLWWPGMYASFENYVKSCKTCLESNKGHDPKIKLKPLEVAHSVFDTIHTGADWTCRPTAPRAVGPWHNHAFFYELICCETYLNFHQKVL